MNEIDEYIHANIPNEVRDKKIRKRLTYFFESLAEGLNSYHRHSEKPIFISISSDHGYTLLPINSKSITISEDSDISHGRVLVSGMPKFEDENLTTRIEEGSEKYYIARDYQHFGQKPKGAVHGGITPQEMIVPSVLISTSEVAQYKNLSVRLEGEVFRGKNENTVKLSFINPNPHKVNILSIHIPNSSTVEKVDYSLVLRYFMWVD